MKNNSLKLLEILSCLRTDEQKLFNKHIERSHAQDSDIVKLISSLYKNRKHLKDENLSDEIKESQFSETTAKSFSNLMSKAKKELEDWLICYDLKESEYDSKLALIKSYNNRGIYVEANREAKKLESKINADAKYDMGKSKAYYRLKDYQYYSDNPIKYQEGVKLLEEVVTSFNAHYRAQIHLYNAELYNWGRIRNHDFSDLINSNLDHVNTIPITELSELTKKLEESLKDFDKHAFDEVYETLLEEKLKEKSMLHAVCCEYIAQVYIQHIRSNKSTRYDLLANIYNYGLRTGGFLKEGKLTLIRFHNMISVLASVNGYEVVDAFIEKWIHLVDTSMPDSTRKIAIIQNCFYNEKYDEISDHLRFLKFENKKQKYRALKFELLAQYEAGDYDILSRTIHNYIRMLKRDKGDISNKFFTIQINLIKVLNYLINNNKESVVFLLNSNQPLIFRQWIKNKLG